MFIGQARNLHRTPFRSAMSAVGSLRTCRSSNGAKNFKGAQDHKYVTPPE